MDFGLTEEQQAIQDTARKFAREKIAPDFQKREETGVIERDLVKEMGTFPEEEPSEWYVTQENAHALLDVLDLRG